MKQKNDKGDLSNKLENIIDHYVTLIILDTHCFRYFYENNIYRNKSAFNKSVATVHSYLVCYIEAIFVRASRLIVFYLRARYMSDNDKIQGWSAQFSMKTCWSIQSGKDA